MPLHVLIVPDKFKGTLTAAAAAQAIAAGWTRARAEDHLTLLPMSDGGDGFGAVMGRLLRAEETHVETRNAAHEPILAPWWWDPVSQSAVIESARVIGLALLPLQRFHPFSLDTFGLGRVLESALERAPRHILIGIGGSATNDGGFGLALALGWKFFAAAGTEIRRWTDLDQLARIDPAPFPTVSISVAVDVQNPLLGPAGATRIYGPQKGLVPADFAKAEACLAQFATVLDQQLGIDARDLPGAGAAGGLGFGLHSVTGARLESGFDLFAERAQLRDQIAAADVILTGEGAIDSSSLMGKGVGEIARLSKQNGVPCIGLAGKITAPDDHGFTRLAGMTPHLTDLTEAQQRPAFWLSALAENMARDFHGQILSRS